MRSLTSWLLTMFMFMFWVFRIIVALEADYQKDFGGFVAFDLKIEIILLFVVVVCLIFILRRKLLGAVVYLIAYGYYFGGYVVNNTLITYNLSSMSIMQNVLVSALGVALAFIVFLDLFLEKARKREPKEKKTDWFFSGEQYDRKLDERADKNQYRNY